MKFQFTKTIINIFILILGLSSCSSGIEYNPAIASTLGNNVFLSIEKKNGEEYDCKDILSKKEISIYGNESRKEIPLRLANYNGRKILDFNADLPNMSSMKYNSEKTEGFGHSDVTITFQSKNLKIRFYYKLLFGEKDFLGTNAIFIDSIECKKKKIKPRKKSNIYIFTLKEDTNGELTLKP